MLYCRPLAEIPHLRHLIPVGCGSRRLVWPKAPFRPVHTARNSPGLSKLQITGVDVVGPDTDSDHKPRLGLIVNLNRIE